MTLTASRSFAPPQRDTVLQALAGAIGGPIAAFDTSTSWTTVCFVDAACGVRQLDFFSPQRPCEVLISGLMNLAEQCGRSLSAGELRALVVGTGPGSFTGLRVGLATAKGLSLGAGVPLYAASSLLMAALEAGPGLVLALQDARHGELFAGLYRIEPTGGVAILLADCAITPADLMGTVEAICAAQHVAIDALHVVGDAAHFFAVAQAQTPWAFRPRAIWGIWQCAPAIRAGHSTNAVALVPQYLRLSQPERQRLARQTP